MTTQHSTAQHGTTQDSTGSRVGGGAGRGVISIGLKHDTAVSAQFTRKSPMRPFPPTLPPCRVLSVDFPPRDSGSRLEEFLSKPKPAHLPPSNAPPPPQHRCMSAHTLNSTPLPAAPGTPPPVFILQEGWPHPHPLPLRSPPNVHAHPLQRTQESTPSSSQTKCPPPPDILTPPPSKSQAFLTLSNNPKLVTHPHRHTPPPPPPTHTHTHTLSVDTHPP